MIRLMKTLRLAATKLSIGKETLRRISMPLLEGVNGRQKAVAAAVPGTHKGGPEAIMCDSVGGTDAKTVADSC